MHMHYNAMLMACFLLLLTGSLGQTCSSFEGKWVPEEAPETGPVEILFYGDLSGRLAINTNVSSSPFECALTISANWVATPVANSPNNYSIAISNFSCGGAALCAGMVCGLFENIDFNTSEAAVLGFDPNDCNKLTDNEGRTFTRYPLPSPTPLTTTPSAATSTPPLTPVPPPSSPSSLETTSPPTGTSRPSSSPEPSPPKSSPGKSPLTILAAVVGALVLIGAASAVIYFVRRRSTVAQPYSELNLDVEELPEEPEPM